MLPSSGFAVPCLAQIEGPHGACLRIDVTEQGTDLEAVLSAPNGMVWRNNRSWEEGVRENRSSSDGLWGEATVEVRGGPVYRE